MKTAHKLLQALVKFKPTQNQLALISAFYDDVTALSFYIETDDPKNEPCGRNLLGG